MSDQKKVEKKEKFITIRISEEDLQLLDAYADLFSKNRSELIRQAVELFIFLNNHPDNKNPKMIISRMLQSKILSFLSIEQIKTIAELSFNIGIQDNFADITINPQEKEQSPADNFRIMMNMLHRYIFSSEGHNWFTSITFTDEPNLIQIGGKHDLGENFSIFILHLLQNYANHYGMKTKKFLTRTDTIFVEFDLKI